MVIRLGWLSNWVRNVKFSFNHDLGCIPYLFGLFPLVLCEWMVHHTFSIGLLHDKLFEPGAGHRFLYHDRRVIWVNLILSWCGTIIFIILTGRILDPSLTLFPIPNFCWIKLSHFLDFLLENFLWGHEYLVSLPPRQTCIGSRKFLFVFIKCHLLWEILTLFDSDHLWTLDWIWNILFFRCLPLIQRSVGHRFFLCDIVEVGRCCFEEIGVGEFGRDQFCDVVLLS